MANQRAWPASLPQAGGGIVAQQQPSRDRVQSTSRLVREQVDSLTRTLRGLDDSGWNAQSACTEWTVKEVASHLTESADRFMMIVQARLADEPAPEFTVQLRNERRAVVKAGSGAEIADQLDKRIDTLLSTVEGATDEQLARTVPVGAGEIPLAVLPLTRLREVTLHSWDIRWAHDKKAMLNPTAVPLLLEDTIETGARLAKKDALAGRDATYRLDFDGEHGGPVTVELRDGAAQIRRGAPERADVTMRLPPEAFIRLIWGRLDMEQALAAGTVKVDGDRSAALGLNPVFRGL
jgi:uncharacterized protein (TIGR03083 family)